MQMAIEATYYNTGLVPDNDVIEKARAPNWRKILETPLGLLSTFMYYYGHEIADSVYYILQNMDTLGRWFPNGNA